MWDIADWWNFIFMILYKTIFPVFSLEVIVFTLDALRHCETSCRVCQKMKNIVSMEGPSDIYESNFSRMVLYYKIHIKTKSKIYLLYFVSILLLCISNIFRLLLKEYSVVSKSIIHVLHEAVKFYQNDSQKKCNGWVLKLKRGKNKSLTQINIWKRNGCI